MGYTISLILKEDAPIEKIENILRDQFETMHGYKWLSSVSDEHGYAPEYDYGLSISYSSLMVEERTLVMLVFADIAEQYGVRKLDVRSGLQFPFYYYDSELTFLIDKDKWSEIETTEYCTVIENELEVIIDDNLIENDTEYNQVVFDCPMRDAKCPYPVNGFSQLIRKLMYLKAFKKAFEKYEKIMDKIKASV